MPRSLSQAARYALNDAETSEGLLVCFDVEHPSLTAETERWVTSSRAVTRGGHVYRPYPISIEFPPAESGRPPQVQLEILNVDARILRVLRALTSPPTVTLTVVLASSPDVAEAGPYRFALYGIKYPRGRITGVLRLDHNFEQPFPSLMITPDNFPTLFEGLYT